MNMNKPEIHWQVGYAKRNLNQTTTFFQVGFTILRISQPGNMQESLSIGLN